ncbi:hypothetical protein [Streptomyces vinaceus]|uniref:hypothetical protein n=1 Tax=Streptomyces vinaceus TaxID=1960 RepID=UPI0035DD0703
MWIVNQKQRHDRLDAARQVQYGAEPLWPAALPAPERTREVREELAEHPDLPPVLRDKLAQDPNLHVALRIFARQDTPDPIRAAIHVQIVSDVPPLDWLADHQALDDDALDRELTGEIARAELRTLRLLWVTADPVPYVNSPYVCFRASAAMSDHPSPQLVAQLLDDEESSVRTTMALHARDQIDPDTAERIDRTYRPATMVRWRPADDFPLPTDALRRLATDPDPRMRQLAPRDPDLPVELARRLAADPDHMVRRTIATHSRLPAEDLTRLLADPSESVAATAAANPNLPTTGMHQLLALAGLCRSVVRGRYRTGTLKAVEWQRVNVPGAGLPNPGSWPRRLDGVAREEHRDPPTTSFRCRQGKLCSITSGRYCAGTPYRYFTSSRPPGLGSCPSSGHG